jgi:hypothetical protein
MLFLIILDIIMIVNFGWLGKIPYQILGKSKEYYVERIYFSSAKEAKLCIIREMQDDIRFFFLKEKKDESGNKQLILKKEVSKR